MRIGAPRHQQAKIKKKPVFKAIPQQLMIGPTLLTFNMNSQSSLLMKDFN
jgi:hypothetical protein